MRGRVEVEGWGRLGRRGRGGMRVFAWSGGEWVEDEGERGVVRVLHFFGGLLDFVLGVFQGHFGHCYICRKPNNREQEAEA